MQTNGQLPGAIAVAEAFRRRIAWSTDSKWTLKVQVANNGLMEAECAQASASTGQHLVRVVATDIWIARTANRQMVRDRLENKVGAGRQQNARSPYSF